MRFSLKWLTVVVLLLFGDLAYAQVNDVGALLQRLKASSDFRVRTQAALALGATKDKRAVSGLCGGLADANTTVRAASAAALGRLALGGRECLQNRLNGEQSKDVRSVIRRALERLGSAEPAISESTRFYVAIREPTNNTSRSNPELDKIVRTALSKHFSRLPGFALAPPSESPEQAKALLKKHPRVKAIFVWPKVKADYAGGNLKMSIDLALFTYPDRAFVGTMSRNLTMPDTEPEDQASEDELIEMAAERFAPDLAKTASRI